MLEQVLERLLWLGHSSFIYEGDPLIYFDPYALHRLRPADIIPVGHDHPHHCSPADIDQVKRMNTVILADEHAAKHIAPPVISMAPGQQETVDDFLIEAVPAYNLHTSFHPRRKAYLGFIVTLAGLRLYHAGDTDFIPEMHDLDEDIALLPISGFTVMEPKRRPRRPWPCTRRWPSRCITAPPMSPLRTPSTSGPCSRAS